MNFDDLDKQMRIYEQSIDQHILPEMYLVARLDGRSFSRLTKEICDFEAPFDVRFRDMMVNTVKALMECGFRVVYGFTESDEICVVIEFDMLAYKKRTNSKAVKKTLTIPEWLNEAASAASINFSQVLQEALLNKLNL